MASPQLAVLKTKEAALRQRLFASKFLREKKGQPATPKAKEGE